MRLPFTCSNCGKVNYGDSADRVQGVPIGQWWDSVGRRCEDCRKLPTHPYHDGQVPRVAGSDTSAAAADSQEPNLGTKQGHVYKLLREAPDGLTDDDLEQLTGWRHQTVSARRRELVLAGLVVDSGRRRVTSSGRQAAVWVVT